MIRRSTSRGLCVALGLAAVSPALGAGYLESVGPPPLRFLLPAAAAVPFVFPPLAMETPNPSPPTNAAAEVAVASASPSEPPAPAVEGPVQTPPEPAPEPPPGSVTIQASSTPVQPPDGAAWVNPVSTTGAAPTPQALMTYFVANGQGGSGPAVVAPVAFTPPPPPVSRPSSATYQRTP
jgi:hypothetical protein